MGLGDRNGPKYLAFFVTLRLRAAQNEAPRWRVVSAHVTVVGGYQMLLA